MKFGHYFIMFAGWILFFVAADVARTSSDHASMHERNYKRCVERVAPLMSDITGRFMAYRSFVLRGLTQGKEKKEIPRVPVEVAAGSKPRNVRRRPSRRICHWRRILGLPQAVHVSAGNRRVSDPTGCGGDMYKMRALAPSNMDKDKLNRITANLSQDKKRR